MTMFMWRRKIRTVVFLDDCSVIHNIRPNNAYLIWLDGLDDYHFPVAPFEESQNIEEFRDTVEKILLLM